jgi:hypothetical protein
MAEIANIEMIGFGSSDANQYVHELRRLLAIKIGAHARHEGDTQTEIPALRLYRRTSQTSCTSAAYEPSLILYGQGQKHVQVGGTTYVCDESTCQLTSVDLPVISQVTRASAQKPILAMVLKLDMAVVREILSQQEFIAPSICTGTRGMALGKSTPELLASCIRLLNLLETPRDIPFLGRIGPARDCLPRIAWTAGQTPQGDCHSWRPKQPHSESRRLAQGKLYETSPDRGLGRCRPDGNLHLPPSLPNADPDEPAPVSKAVAPAHGAHPHDERRTGCCKCRLRSWLRKRQPVQPRISPAIWPIADTRREGTSNNGRRSSAQLGPYHGGRTSENQEDWARPFSTLSAEIPPDERQAPFYFCPAR